MHARAALPVQRLAAGVTDRVDAARLAEHLQVPVDGGQPDGLALAAQLRVDLLGAAEAGQARPARPPAPAPAVSRAPGYPAPSSAARAPRPARSPPAVTLPQFARYNLAPIPPSAFRLPGGCRSRPQVEHAGSQFHADLRPKLRIIIITSAASPRARRRAMPNGWRGRAAWCRWSAVACAREPAGRPRRASLAGAIGADGKIVAVGRREPVRRRHPAGRREVRPGQRGHEQPEHGPAHVRGQRRDRPPGQRVPAGGAERPRLRHVHGHDRERGP